MPFLQVAHENAHAVELYFEDHGSGEPVVLIHGWPLSSRSWEKQVPALLNAGYRVISYDRRGFGESSKPTQGYDYDTFARDLDALMAHLDLHGATLVGFSMGGGEVARYLGAFGSQRVKRAVFVGAITPALLKGDSNPEGLDAAVFEDIKKGILEDRPAFLSSFLSNFYNVDKLKGKSISTDAVQLSWTIAAMASPTATLECVTAWGTDFRKELSQIRIPTLVIHGDADRIVPFEASGKRLAQLIAGSKTVLLKNAPHGLNWTHSDQLNQELLSFLGAVSTQATQKAG